MDIDDATLKNIENKTKKSNFEVKKLHILGMSSQFGFRGHWNQNINQFLPILPTSTCKSTLLYCVKIVLVRSFCGPYFRAFGLSTERYPISPYSVRIRENTDQKNSEYRNFLSSVNVSVFPNPSKYFVTNSTEQQDLGICFILGKKQMLFYFLVSQLLKGQCYQHVFVPK